jgi:O-6-methylguanine DNA methyltransferase
MTSVLIQTKAGNFLASFTEKGLARLEFPSHKAGRKRRSSTSASKVLPEWQRKTQTALESLLQGCQPIDFPPFDLTEGTEFQRKVWSVLSAIPLGQTKTYTEVAQATGRPKATRAAGQACGANPIPVLIPCHRVVAANHKLGGFSGGLEWKQILLAIEGVAVNGSPDQAVLGL